MRLSVETLHMKVDYNPYEGREVTGVTDTVISRGKVIIDGGKFTGRAGRGTFSEEECAVVTFTDRARADGGASRFTKTRRLEEHEDKMFLSCLRTFVPS